MQAEQIAQALGNAKRVNGQWVASCPVPSHGQGKGDRNPSLSISDADTDAMVLFKCHGGCDQDSVFRAVKDMGLLPELPPRPHPLDNLKPFVPVVSALPPTNPSNLEHEWHYTDEDGVTLFIKQRFKTNTEKGKDYRLVRVMPNGSRVNRLGDARIVCYNLPAVIGAVESGRAIYLCEGEKACDALIGLGVVATTSHAGSGSWPTELTQYFVNANVVVVPDNDQPGWKYAKKVVECLLDAPVRSIRVIDLNLPFPGDDAYEFVGMGYGKMELAQLAKEAQSLKSVHEVFVPEHILALTATEPVTPEPLEVAEVGVESGNDASLTDKPKKTFKIESWDDIQDQPVEWLIDGVLPKKSFVALYGPPASFKSFVALDMAYSVASGVEWMSNPVNSPGAVLYICGEGHGGMGARIKACKIFKGSQGGEPLFVIRHQINLRSNHDDFLALIEGIDNLLTSHQLSLSLVIIDTLARSFGGGNENSSEDMSSFITQCGRLMERYETSLMLLHHSGKDISKGLRGHSSLLGAVDTELELVRVDSMIKSTEIAGQGILTITKQKDGEDNRKIGFEVVPVVLKSSGIGLDDITSLAVQSSDSVVRDRQEQAKSNRGSKAGKGKNQRLEMQSLKIAMNSKGYSSSTPEGFKKVVDVEHWRQEFGLMVREKDTSDDTFNKAWVRCKKNLQESGQVRVRGNLVWMVRDEDQKEEF